MPPGPKSKISRSRRGMRRAHKSLKNPAVHSCANCGSMKRPHRVCLSCGYYNDKEVIAPRA